MEEHETTGTVPFDPSGWTFHVRRTDGTWLARPARDPERTASNTPTWTRRIPDCWTFQSHHEARDAAISHGIDDDDFAVIPQPRRPGEWLAGDRRSTQNA